MIHSIIKPVLSLTALATLALLHATPAQAVQIAKTWVAFNGNDGNPCTAALPCATLQHAHDTTLPSGEIGVLTAGDYGPLTIGKSISVTNDGAGEASILAGIVSSVGIAIFAGAGDVVSLRGLVIDGLGTGGLSELISFRARPCTSRTA